MIETKLPLVKKNTHEVFESSSYLKVIDGINTNIRSNTSVIVLTGEPGTGKTLIVRKVLKDLEGKNYTVFLQHPRFTFDEMLSSAYEQVGVPSVDQKNDLQVDKKLKVFYEYLEKRSQEKGPVRFFIDDAQDVNADTLCNFLKLLKWRTDAKRTLQVILIGLPQLETLLASPELRELKTANPIYLHLKPLDTEEVGAFVSQRLNAFGIEQDDFFPLEAVAKIAQYTKGIPSLVAILFDSVMAIMNSIEHGGVTSDIVDEAVDTFSLAWATDNKSFHAIQSPSAQKKVDFDKSKQISSSSKDNKLDKKTIISEIRGKVTDLFFQNKMVNNESARDHRVGNNNVEDEKEIFEALAEELRDEDHNMDIEEEKFEPLAEKLKFLKIQPSLQQNKQVETMNRGEHLNKVLKALQSGSPDVEAVALISEDGLMVANALPQDLDEIRVGGMSATLLSLGTRSSAELRRGKVEEIIVRGEYGYTVMLNAGRGTILLVVANQNAKLGLIFFDMHETIEKIAEIL